MVAWVNSPHFIIAEQHSTVRMELPQCPSPMDGPLYCVQFGPVMNMAAMSILGYDFCWTRVQVSLSRGNAMSRTAGSQGDMTTLSPKQVSSCYPSVGTSHLSPPSPQWTHRVAPPNSRNSRSFGLIWESWTAVLTSLLPSLWAQGPLSQQKGPLSWAARREPSPLRGHRTFFLQAGNASHGTSGLPTWGLSLCFGHLVPIGQRAVVKLFLSLVPSTQPGQPGMHRKVGWERTA